MLRPIFIMGLHRSGTTFLYQTLSELLPVAPVTVHHIVNFPRLESGFRSGTTEADKRELNARFERLGLATRLLDGIPLSADTVEEYGWLIQRYAKSMWLERRTVPFFTSLCRTLSSTTPGAEALLLKSPWDVANGPFIAKAFPQAKFIYLHRDPVAILNSQFAAHLHYGRDPDPFLDLLSEGCGLVRGVTAVRRTLCRGMRAGDYAQLGLRLIARDVARQVARCRESLAQVPSGSALELSYEELLAEPEPKLREIASFLDLPPQQPLHSVLPQPRNRPLAPEVAAYAGTFRRRLAKLGVPEYRAAL